MLSLPVIPPYSSLYYAMSETLYFEHFLYLTPHDESLAVLLWIKVSAK